MKGKGKKVTRRVKAKHDKKERKRRKKVSKQKQKILICTLAISLGQASNE